MLLVANGQRPRMLQCTYTYSHVYTCTHMHMPHTQPHTHTHIHIHTQRPTYTYIHMPYTHQHTTHTDKHTHTDPHTSTHMYTWTHHAQRHTSRALWKLQGIRSPAFPASEAPHPLAHPRLSLRRWQPRTPPSSAAGSLSDCSQQRLRSQGPTGCNWTHLTDLG